MMQKRDEQFIFSPTDLTRYINSPFASWMDRYAIECPNNAPEKDPDDELTKSLSQKGYEHEDTLKDYFIKQGLNVVSINASSNNLKTQQTQDAMQHGVDVIFQGRLEQPPFAGFSDFLVKVDHTNGEPNSLLGNWHYEVWDTKLSSKVKPTFVIQLCCYAEMLKSIQGVLPESIVVALGNGKQTRLRTLDYFAYYQSSKQEFLETQSQFDQMQQPDPAHSSQWANWSQYANQLLTERDHLSQVATITRSQIKKLEKAGITTMKGLAEADINYVPGLHKEVLTQLKAQASIQKLSEGKPVPEFIIRTNPNNPKQGLALLPPHSKSDVFFDIEGYPLDEGGLEYLWGNTYFDDQGVPGTSPQTVA